MRASSILACLTGLVVAGVLGTWLQSFTLFFVITIVSVAFLWWREVLPDIRAAAPVGTTFFEQVRGTVFGLTVGIVVIAAWIAVMIWLSQH